MTRQLEGRALGVAEAAPGDQVSIHWSWARDTLKPHALERLRRHRQRYLELASQTL